MQRSARDGPSDAPLGTATAGSRGRPPAGQHDVRSVDSAPDDASLARLRPVAAVMFDVGGTLDADGVPWSAQFHAAYRAYGGALPLEPFVARFRESDRRLA